jgi:periplasmic protein TonB
MDFSDNQKEGASRRLTGLIVVALLHIAIVYALVTGLARKVVEVIRPPVETRIIEDVKLPPPQDKAPPPPKFAPPPPAYIPPPEINIQQPLSAQQNAITSVTTAPPPVQAAPRPAPAAVIRVPPVIDAARSCQPPEYPVASRRNEETGTVTLRFLIGVDGKVVESNVESSSGYPRLDEAARRALGHCQFKAGTVDGKPEQSWARLQYVWKLE